MDTAEKAKQIRSELKAAGLGGRRVSVRISRFAGGSAIDVTVRDPSVPLERVRQIAERQEEIRRDGFGEILGGGNCYVHVRDRSGHSY